MYVERNTIKYIQECEIKFDTVNISEYFASIFIDPIYIVKNICGYNIVSNHIEKLPINALLHYKSDIEKNMSDTEQLVFAIKVYNHMVSEVDNGGCFVDSYLSCVLSILLHDLIKNSLSLRVLQAINPLNSECTDRLYRISYNNSNRYYFTHNIANADKYIYTFKPFNESFDKEFQDALNRGEEMLPDRLSGSFEAGRFDS